MKASTNTFTTWPGVAGSVGAEVSTGTHVFAALEEMSQPLTAPEVIARNQA